MPTPSGMPMTVMIASTARMGRPSHRNTVPTMAWTASPVISVAAALSWRPPTIAKTMPETIAAIVKPIQSRIESTPMAAQKPVKSFSFTSPVTVAPECACEVAANGVDVVDDGRAQEVHVARYDGDVVAHGAADCGVAVDDDEGAGDGAFDHRVGADHDEVVDGLAGRDPRIGIDPNERAIPVVGALCGCRAR